MFLYFTYSVFHACFEHIKVTIVVTGEFIVGSILQDVAIAYDKENVAVSNGAEAMSDYDRSSPFHSSIKSLLYDFLTLLVQGRCCFIQYENFGVLDKSPCNSYPLLLATGKFAALQATVLFEAFMESEFAIDHLLLDSRLHQSMVPLVDEVHPIIAHIVTDEKRKFLNSRYSIF